jgi:DNA-3-methyladenine glycosylase II
MIHYKQHLSRYPELRPLLKNEIFIPVPMKNITQGLVWSILSQQLSIKVAKILFSRFIDLYGGKAPSPRAILKTPPEQIRGIGISHQKLSYIYNVANFMLEQKITLAKLQKLSDEQIIELLTQIKGVGRWSVEMLLIFGLGREDVFAVDDLGIQQAMIKLYQLQNLDKQELKKRMLQLSQKWSPYRTYVCLHMWNFKGF